jgi:hypothetical protein
MSGGAVMGILSYIKIGGAVILLSVASYFYFNYQHLQKVVEAQKTEIVELKKATNFYEKQPGEDKKTAEVKNEIQKAVDSGDAGRVRDLYRQLQQHKSPGKGVTP